jgi:uncharacterized DUF497 family protein
MKERTTISEGEGRDSLLVYWQKFDPEEFEFEFDEDELARHDVSVDEATEVIWNRFEVGRNKRHHGGYQLVGRTDSGRKLKLIVYEKSAGVIRVITGWDL